MQFYRFCFIFKSPQIKMNAKPFLKSFWQVISISKIFVLQILSLFFLSYSCGLLAEATGARGCPPRYEFMGIIFYFTLAMSVVIFILSLHPIVFPQIWLEEISKEFTGSQLAFRFPFFQYSSELYFAGCSAFYSRHTSFLERTKRIFM